MSDGISEGKDMQILRNDRMQGVGATEGEEGYKRGDQSVKPGAVEVHFLSKVMQTWVPRHWTVVTVLPSDT